jgi:hypothetical protein
MKILVNVTQTDINQGSPACLSCPVALALHRVVDCYEISVRLKRIKFFRNLSDSGTAIDTPVNVYNWVAHYDYTFKTLEPRSNVKPFSFELEIPNSIADLIKQ